MAPIGTSNGNGSLPGLHWPTAGITVVIAIIGVVGLLLSGAIPLGGSNRQIEVNTHRLDVIEAGGSPPVIALKAELAATLKSIERNTAEINELKADQKTIDVFVQKLPVADAELKGRIIELAGSVDRLNSVTVKKTDDWPIEIQRIARLEQDSRDISLRLGELRSSVVGHDKQDEDGLRDQIKALQLQLDSERQARVLAEQARAAAIAAALASQNQPKAPPP